ncbi:hypothetical protein CBL_13943 [Carabus blaptoides fortunei]
MSLLLESHSYTVKMLMLEYKQGRGQIPIKVPGRGGLVAQFYPKVKSSRKEIGMSTERFCAALLLETGRKFHVAGFRDALGQHWTDACKIMGKDCVKMKDKLPSLMPAEVVEFYFEARDLSR